MMTEQPLDPPTRLQKRNKFSQLKQTSIKPNIDWLYFDDKPRFEENECKISVLTCPLLQLNPIYASNNIEHQPIHDNSIQTQPFADVLQNRCS